MDTIERLMEEENRIREMLEKAVPGTTEYQNLKNDLLDIQKARVELQKADDQRVDQNWKRELEESRVIAEEKAAALEEKAKKRHDWTDVLKTSIAVLGTLVGIVITGHMEETQILSQKCWSLINKPKV